MSDTLYILKYILHSKLENNFDNRVGKIALQLHRAIHVVRASKLYPFIFFNNVIRIKGISALLKRKSYDLVIQFLIIQSVIIIQSIR